MSKVFSLEDFRNKQIPIESEIMSKWNVEIDIPIVSIVCMTYNQESYIGDTIKGFLIQNTNFPFEIIIHDDASNDKTVTIIKEYQSKYPNIIKPIYQNINQYSQGIKIIKHCIKEAKGKYIAICEGDDFWISEYKLQQQYEVLYKNKSIKLCFTKATFLYKNNRVGDFSNYGNEQKVFSLSKVVRGGGGFMPTCSLFLEKKVLENLPKWYDFTPICDYYWQILGSIEGAIYLPLNSSVYRVNSINSWSSNRKSCSIEKIVNELIIHEYSLDELIKNGVSKQDINYAKATFNYITSVELILRNSDKYINFIEKSWELYPKQSLYQNIIYLFRKYPKIIKFLYLLKQKININ